MLSNVILLLCGLVMLLAALLVLHLTHRAEVSLRTIGALLVGAGGAWCVARGTQAAEVPALDLILPVGVALWIVGAMWRRRALPPDQIGGVLRAPWAGSAKDRR